MLRWLIHPSVRTEKSGSSGRMVPAYNRAAPSLESHGPGSGSRFGPYEFQSQGGPMTRCLGRRARLSERSAAMKCLRLLGAPGVVAVSLVCVLGGTTEASAQASDVEVTPDVVYGHKYGMALTFDVLRPADPNGAGVLRMESGGWRSRWRPTDASVERYRALLDHGFTVFTVRHGSRPKFVIAEIVPDVRRAVRFIRLHASDFGVDRNRLGVWGGSAGGHLSLMIGTVSDSGDPSTEDPVLRMDDRVAAVVAYYPPVDLRPFNARSVEPADAAALSPLLHVTPDDPPTLLIHGDQDETVNVSNSQRMYEALQEHGVESKLIIIEGAGHGYSGTDAERASAAMVEWFLTHLAQTN